ncbi:MAG TPA: protein kinase [Blastocatellia bacterium]|nr:protein kinase [Blastocatellia bacterium]HMX28034.1 protein kinase [Blastocatellia bacterium]HMY73575.1 protein kinase [Blastocatellia bacterium]HMZ17846.1 protein kinase [Blastocatellia bacterium]HNG29706.1 protein kinase [Blastocatellia bacterium]
MTSHQWRKVDELLDRAMELSPAERAAFLDRECHGDAAMRREIESLLRAHDAASGFFDGGPVSVAEDLIQNRQAEAMAGRTIGHYQLTREIGRGGMGVVYEAFRADDQFRQKVAIKLLWPGMNSSEIARRFRHERQILANLDHPHIARLLDGGVTEEGLPYFAMEFVEGRPLTDYCNERKLSIAERLKLFEQVCSAVQYAHQNLIIHRDLKPGNILVTPPSEGNAGTAKLLDFGIAKLLDPARHAITAQPTTHALLMTPEYASPEQMRGEAIATTSDVYSLGILLYELLTGEHPYRIKDRFLPELVRVVCEQEPEAPSERLRQTPEAAPLFAEAKPERLRAQLRGDLDQITQTAIQKDANLRYRSVEQLSEDLRRHLEGLPITARKASLAYRTEKFIRRNRAGVMAAALILLTLLGGIVATARQARIAQTERSRAEQQAAEAGRQKLSAETQAAEALRQKNLAETKSKEAEENSARAEEQRSLAEEQKGLALDQAERNRRLLYAAQMNLAGQAWDTDNVRRLREIVNQYWPKLRTQDLRGFEWSYLWSLAYPTEELSEVVEDSAIHCLAFSNDGQRLAIGYDDFAIRIWEVATGKKLTTLRGHTRHVRGLAFSPDGKTLASASADGTGKVWNLTTNKEMVTLKGHTHFVNTIAFSPDGKSVATGSRDNTWRLWEVVSGRSTLSVESHATWVNTLAFSPDGKTLVTGNGGRPTIKLWEIKTGKEQASFDGQGAIWKVSFFPDGTRVVASSKDRTVRILNLDAGQEAITLRGHTGEVLGLSVSPDGRIVASCGTDRTIRFWNATTGLEVGTLKSDYGAVVTVAFSPDGKKIAAHNGGGHAKIWATSFLSRFTASKPQSSAKSGERFYAIAFSPDGKHFLTGGDSIRLWETSSGQEVVTLKGNTNIVRAVAFSPDGKTIAATDGTNHIKLWEAATLREYHKLGGGPETITSFSFSSDSKKVLLGTRGGTHAPARLFDISSEGELFTFFPYGSKFPSGQVAKIPAGTHVLPAGAFGISEIAAISPVGNLAAVSVYTRTFYNSEARYEIWVNLMDVLSRNGVATLEGYSNPISAIAFSPDGTILGTGSIDGTVKLWAVNTRRELATLSGHASDVMALAFSPDGTRLATGSAEGVIKLWDMTTKMELISLRGHTDQVTSVAFSPTEEMLASTSLDGTVRFWRAATKEEVAARRRQ